MFQQLGFSYVICNLPHLYGEREGGERVREKANVNVNDIQTCYMYIADEHVNIGRGNKVYSAYVISGSMKGADVWPSKYILQVCFL